MSVRVKTNGQDAQHNHSSVKLENCKLFFCFSVGLAFKQAKHKKDFLQVIQHDVDIVDASAYSPLVLLVQVGGYALGTLNCIYSRH